MSGSTPLRQRAERVLGWPLRRALDRRVQWMVNLLDERLAQRLEGQSRQLGERLDRAIGELGDALRPLDAHLLEAQDHSRAAEQRSRETLRTMGRIHTELAGGGPSDLQALGADVAAFLNWCDGPQGYAAQAGMWFNPAVPVEHHAGRVDVLLVNERVIEQPFVFRALSRLPPPARLLDVGGAESTVALSLASLGYEVSVVDPRGYPLEHRNITREACRLEDLSPNEPFDAAVALSSVEHFGLDHYESRAGGDSPGRRASDAGTGALADGRAHRADVAAVADLARRVRPDGLLVLTVPLGEPAVDDFQRVYDAAGVTELLGEWSVVESVAAWRTDRLTWVAGSIEAPAGDRGVALVVAVNSSASAHPGSGGGGA